MDLADEAKPFGNNGSFFGFGQLIEYITIGCAVVRDAKNGFLYLVNRSRNNIGAI